MDNFCWSVGTYTCKNQTKGCFNPTEENKVYQRYYQWISLVFIIQAIIMYMPAYLWKITEGGLMHKICNDLDAIFKQDKWNMKKNILIDYFKSQYVDRMHMKYVQHFIILKMLSFAFILFNIFLLSIIIPGFWSQYYKAISALLAGDMINWLIHIEKNFSITGKCTFEPYRPSGTIQQFDALCLLPLNILNQKLFLIVWLCYILQIIISFLNLLFWLIITLSENARIYILYQEAQKSVSHEAIENASRKARLGHFFVLSQIARNTNPGTFIELVSNF
ncbi:innexin inx4-like [Contarinia nasturtii]|uniref:innexin inx4-like n=1 Tax=Contarinia nasturtii TaxID=265458 RepID=UPI0012D45D25|nr:innexin inx4-like [Contarinia nasturtii]